MRREPPDLVAQLRLDNVADIRQVRLARLHGEHHVVVHQHAELIAGVVVPAQVGLRLRKRTRRELLRLRLRKEEAAAPDADLKLRCVWG